MPDQRVPQSSLTITKNTNSETVHEFWHGTGVVIIHRGAQWCLDRHDLG